MSRQLQRFAMIGAVGFMIDGGLLWLLVTGDVSAYAARLVSFPIAVLVTWWLNRIWTFEGAARARPRRQLRNYFLLQIVGTLGNLAVYLAILSAIAPTPLNALGALAVGAAVGLVINFVGSRRLVFVGAASAPSSGKEA